MRFIVRIIHSRGPLQRKRPKEAKSRGRGRARRKVEKRFSKSYSVEIARNCLERKWLGKVILESRSRCTRCPSRWFGTGARHISPSIIINNYRDKNEFRSLHTSLTACTSLKNGAKRSFNSARSHNRVISRERGTFFFIFFLFLLTSDLAIRHSSARYRSLECCVRGS